MRDRPDKATSAAELKASSISQWDNEGGAGPGKTIHGWLIAVVYLRGESDARGVAERWAASFDDPQAAMAAVVKKSGVSNPKVVRRLDAAELAGAGITEDAMVAPFEPNEKDNSSR